MVTILKFGGSSLIAPYAFRNVAKIIKCVPNAVAVLSAPYGITNELSHIVNLAKDGKNEEIVKSRNVMIDIHTAMSEELTDGRANHVVTRLINKYLCVKTGVIKSLIDYPTYGLSLIHI